jgi:outer membrane lipoprotein-sorting protein
MWKKSAVVLVAILFMGTETIANAAKEDPSAKAKEILRKVEKNITSNDEIANLKMIIVEADGSKKERELEIKRKGGEGKQKVIVKMNAPSDLKGTSLLSVSKGTQSDQWLYLPSSKQTRRIQSGKKSSSFMDSELSYEDMGATSDTKVESKFIKEETVNGRKFAVIENILKGESSYGKVMVWVDLETFLVGKTEAFDKSLKPLKVSTFSGYKQFDKGVWRAQKVSVSNLQNKRGTVLELSDLKLNKGIDDEEFTESALTQGD